MPEALEQDGAAAPLRPRRADAARNLDAVLAAATAVFATSGVDAPVREIATKAGVGTATIYRHYPRRSDLVKAVFRREVDDCADDAPALTAGREPLDALQRWLQRYTRFLAAKRGLAAALHSGDPAFDALPDYFDQRFRPVLTALLEAAADAGSIRPDADPDDLLRAVANLCMTTERDRAGHSERMVALLVDGLRYGADRGGDQRLSSEPGRTT